MNKNHYVYLLINRNPIDSRKYYIGTRSCFCKPEDDIYFSSSKVIKEIIKNNNKNVFYKKILKTFDSRECAISFEIFLHSKYDVGNNIKFYNIVKQTSTKFDTTGFLFINGKKIPLADYYMGVDKYHSTGKITLKDKNENIHYVDVNDTRYINGELIPFNCGLVPVLNIVTGKHCSVNKNVFYNEKNKFIATNKDKVVVKNKDNEKFLIDKYDDKYISGEYVFHLKDKILCRDQNNKVGFVTKEIFSDGNYVGINKGRVSNENNPNAKLINIYDENNNKIFSCNGDFKTVCLDNNLPFISLARSYRNNGEKIYNTKRGIIEAEKRNMLKYVNWYAIIV